MTKTELPELLLGDQLHALASAVATKTGTRLPSASLAKDELLAVLEVRLANSAGKEAAGRRTEPMLARSFEDVEGLAQRAVREALLHGQPQPFRLNRTEAVAYPPPAGTSIAEAAQNAVTRWEDAAGLNPTLNPTQREVFNRFLAKDGIAERLADGESMQAFRARAGGIGLIDYALEMALR